MREFKRNLALDKRDKSISGAPRERGPFPVKVNLRFFSTFRRIVSVRERTMELPPGASLGDLQRCLLETYPGLTLFEKSMLLAINEELASLDVELKDGDEVAVMPPVGGG